MHVVHWEMVNHDPFTACETHSCGSHMLWEGSLVRPSHKIFCVFWLVFLLFNKNFLTKNLVFMCWILLMWQIPGTDKFAKVIDFLRRQLHRETLVRWSLVCFFVVVVTSGLHNINLLYFFFFLVCLCQQCILSKPRWIGDWSV